MTRVGRAAVLLFLGGVVGRLLWSGGFGRFVQQRMRWPLIIATVVLLVFGVYELIDGIREEERNPDAVKQSRGPRVGWLMVLPLLVLVSVAPKALGAAAADRVDAYVPAEATADTFPDLDTSNGPAPLSVYEFLDRAVWDEEESLEGVPIRLEGLVVNDASKGDGFLLTRFLVSCCAADGVPMQVMVRGASRPYPDDTWVIAEVVWNKPDVPYRETDTEWVIEADAISVTEVPNAPNDPYESPYSF